MKLSTLSSVKKVLFSLEVFPPKKDTSVNVIYNTLLGLRGLPVDFISVTYGAGGSQVQKNKTCEIASLIRSNYHIEPVSHLTCVGSQKEDIAASLDALQEKVNTLAAAKKKEERQKAKLLSKIMELDADDELYDAMYDDLQGLLRQRMKHIAELDTKINQVNIAIQNAGSKAATAEEVYTIMRNIVDMMDIMPERDEQEIMHILLDSVQIYPERQPNGLWIKSVRFKVPLEFDGVLWQDVIIDNEENSLPNESNDETVVLLRRETVDGEESSLPN